MSLDARVEVRRGDFRLALHLAVADGETVAVVGPNGAGKTTLLRALSGLAPLATGRITLAGRLLDDVDTGMFLAPRARRIGVVFQDHRLFPHLSARDNVAFALRCSGTARKEAASRADAALAALGLGSQAALRPAALSGGQAQRVALARVMVGRPGLLLLDEPLGALDAVTAAEVTNGLRDHLRAFEGPALLVTHDAGQATALADRIVVLEAGSVVQEGDAATLAARPATAYVAELFRRPGPRGAVPAG